MEITRKEFLLTALAMAAGTLGFETACGSSDDGSGGSGGAPSGGAGGEGHGGHGAAGAGSGATAGGGDAGSEGGAGGEVTVTACETDVALSDNHIHDLAVLPDDVAAGDTQTYTTSESEGHTHEVSLSASDFERLRRGETVALLTSNDFGHEHDVAVTCT